MFYQNSSDNLSYSTVLLPSEYCRRFQDEDHRVVSVSVTLASIILNAFSCPLIVVMNVLVIAAVRTKRTLQNMSNILLACLAGTDLLVGTATLPASIVAEIFAIADGSVTTYCNIVTKLVSPLRFLSVLASLFHLVVISVERYIALKYPLQYQQIVTKFRLAIAVAIAWFAAGAYTLFKLLVVNSLPSTVLQFVTILSLFVIAYCHISVYFTSRRHEKQIQSEQIPADAAAKFIAEKKAWKTTSVIIGFVLLCLLPGNFISIGGKIASDTKWVNIFRPLVHSCLMLNSLCNPIIYCFRSKVLREAMIAILTRSNSN